MPVALLRMYFLVRESAVNTIQMTLYRTKIISQTYLSSPL